MENNNHELKDTFNEKGEKITLLTLKKLKRG